MAEEIQPDNGGLELKVVDARSRRHYEFLKSQLVELLQASSKKKTLLNLTDKLAKRAEAQNIDKITPMEVEQLLAHLKVEGHYRPRAEEYRGKIIYTLSSEPARLQPVEIGLDQFPDGRVRFGAIANTELGNTYHRDDALLAYYRTLQRENVKFVLHCGDILAGEENAKNREEIDVMGYDHQVEYLIKNYPKIDGIKTLFITAPDCEGKFIKKHGLTIGKYIQSMAQREGREDLVYLGHQTQDVLMSVPAPQGVQDAKEKTAIVRMGHLSGKVPYARSYPAQKMVQSIQGGTKPHVLLLGHLMQFETLFDREIWTVQVGGFKDQTPSMVNERQHADVGGYIIEIKQPLPNEERFHDQEFAMIAEPIVYFNREFYQRNNEYRRKRK